MATTIEKIQNLLSKVGKGKSHKVNFYAESTLDDGRVIATEDDAIGVGVVVKVIDEDGVAYELEEGTYTLADGTPLVIGQGGMVSGLGDTTADVAEVGKTGEISDTAESKSDSEVDDTKTKPPAKKGGDDSSKGKTKASKIEEEVYMNFEEIEDEDRAKEIIDFVKEKIKEYEEEEIEEEEKEEEVMMSNEETEKVEFSSVVGNLMTRIDELETKLSDIENTPAEQGVTINPTGDEYAFSARPKDLFEKVSKKDVLKMTTSERAQFMIQNKITRI